MSIHSVVSAVAATASDRVFALQPALAVKSAFSEHLPENKTTVLRERNDPFRTIAEALQGTSESAAVTATLPALFQGVSSLGGLKDRNVVVHVDVTEGADASDYGLIAALRHSGLVFVQSFGADTEAVAVAAHAIAHKLGQPVVHFFAAGGSQAGCKWTADKIQNALAKFAPLAVAEDESETEPVQANVYETVTEALAYVGLKPFEYAGPSSATNAVVLLSSATEAFVRAAREGGDTGVVLIRAYRPWSSADLLAAVPKSVKRLGFAEQLLRQTTAFSPLVQDYLADLLAAGNAATAASRFDAVVSFQLGAVDYDNVKPALKAIAANLSSETPVQNLFVGAKTAVHTENAAAAAATAAAKRLEEPYTKVLGQLFGDRIQVLNASDKPDAGLATNPEYGFGAYLAAGEKRQELIQRVRAAVKSAKGLSGDLQDALSAWLLAVTDGNAKNQDAGSAVVSALKNDASEAARELLAYEPLFKLNTSYWLIGSDAWSYDLGSSGVHNVVSSGKNVNMLVVDSQPYSEVLAASQRKKDIGLYAMGFGNIYVASVAVYASYTQLLEALLEAEKFDGPSVVVAYLPYHTETDDAMTVLKETKRAVEVGYWPLYRYDPSADNADNAFKLDSFQIRQQLKDFLERENKLTMLANRSPALARGLVSSYGADVRAQQRERAKKAYAKLLEDLSGPPLTVLFASDGGQAESVAKRLARRAKGRGLKAVAMAMDDYPVEDELANEENVVFVTSTAGQGEFPQNGRQFWDAVKSATDMELGNVRFAVFGMGDSEYWPRKEDKHYYNKPSKDLYNRIKILGASELVPLGQGDDQDADGWSTGYNAWEPLLWEALGVAGVAGADEPPPITNEDIKINSNYLRGTIAEGLQDKSTGAIAATDQQLTKFHGIYMQDDRDVRDQRKAQGLEPAYSFMVRVRLPGCVATPAQWLKIDELSDRRGNGTFKITTRGTFQLHGVIKEDLKPAIRGINSSLIDTVAACGDVNRNVVTAALPQNAKIHRAIVDVADGISEHLLPETTAYYEVWLEGEDEGDGPDYTKTFETREKGPKKKPAKTLVSGSTLVDHEPLYGPTYLPRKFKINIAVPPHNDVDVYGHDIGLIAIVEDNELVGFNVLAGGGMGTTHNNKKTYPRTGSLLGFCKTDVINDVCEKIMLVQRDFGDRKNRKHARLKYTIDDMGVDEFRSKVEEYLGYKLEPAREFSFESNTDTFGWVTDEDGLHHFTTFVENGRVEDTPELQFKTGLREIAKVLQVKGGEFRLTANQHILVSNITSELRPEIEQLLAQYKLDNLQFSGLRLSSAACVAFPTCGLAMAESERYLPVLVTKLEDALEEYGLRRDSIVMRMTGCPNGCARPWLAEVALVGKAYGAYNLMLGGGFHGQRLNKLYRNSIKEDEIIATLKPLFKRWALERNDGEHFGDFLIRVGVIAATTEGKNFWDNIPEDA